MEESMEKINKLKDRGLTGSALKWIAILAMLIDHIGAFLIEPYLSQKGIPGGLFFGGLAKSSPYYGIFQINLILRLIGRLAFPIFTFLLVEGFLHTRNIKRYIVQMGIFALISEIPFDLANSSLMMENTYQNVFFTLFIGLLVITIFDKIHKKNNIRWLIPIVGMIISEILRTDYSSMGIIIIFIFYYFHDDFKLRNLFNGLMFSLQITAIFALIPIQLYNGKRGKQNKFFFYIFYPAHLILLFLIRNYLK